jgi:signal transduction histidine kinase
MQAKGDAQVSRSLLVFYLLVIYVFLQFLWWSYLLFNLNGEVSQLKAEMALLKGESQHIESYENALKNKWLMIFGEGMVFLILLTLGIIQTRKTFKKEVALIRQQKNFLLSITHELKSPIASIKLYLQTLNKRDFDKEKRDEIIHKAIGDTDRLDNLVENMLLASRIESSAFHIELSRINLSDTIQDYVNHINHSLSERNKIKTNIEQDVYVQGDELYINSIIGNLIENARKYSKPDTDVLMKLENNGQHVVLSVSDFGIGIPEHERVNIFMKFYRAGNEETRKTKGTGLGLYIVAKLAALHKASLQVYDNVPHGSVFEIKFKPD